MQSAERRKPGDEIEELLRQSVQAFVARNPGAARLRSLRDKPGTADAWAALADAGWFSIRVPETRDGLGLGVAELCAVAEELSRGLAPEPFVAGSLAISIVAAGDNQDLVTTELPDLMAGTKRVALAWQEAPNVLDPTHIAIHAKPADGGVVLSGRKTLIPGAAEADAFLVTALSGGALTVWWIDRNQPGVALDLHATIDGVALGDLILDNVHAPASVGLFRGDAGAIIRNQLEEGRLAAAAALFGLLQQALSITTDYARTREQFGKPIGSFQSIQHRLVDMWMQQEVTRNVLAHAIGVFTSTDDPAARASAASAAKAQASRAAMIVTRQSIQIHGGVGYADEHDIGLFLKRAIVLSGWLGSASLHRRRYADENPIAAIEDV
jgi:alkylation response protein AidB-like acyl-CoA dehydrogenase